jgi:hypothetical protein
MTIGTVENHPVVSQAEWIIARKDLLVREKQLTHERDAMDAARRALPWVLLEKKYVFEGADGNESHPAATMERFLQWSGQPYRSLGALECRCGRRRAGCDPRRSGPMLLCQLQDSESPGAVRQIRRGLA